MVAERIVNSNLKENIQDLQGELNIITNSIRDMIDNCDDKLSQVIKQVEKTNQMWLLDNFKKWIQRDKV